MNIGFQVSALAVFFQGLLSFLSPCVLPLIPVYLGYLAGGTAERGEDGEMIYPRGKMLGHTVFFILGVSFAFFLLGMGATALGSFFRGNSLLFMRAGGIVMVLFGIYQLAFSGRIGFLEREYRLPFEIGEKAMSPLLALFFGFAVSFAWTPCVGPALTAVLWMAASSPDRAAGFLYIGLYTLGFVLPFLALGFFTSEILRFLRSHRAVQKYSVRIGGFLLLLIGCLMLSGRIGGTAAAPAAEAG
ncbi:MAG: cytochrome c biogenesis protein CcdA, partial [Clostridium sp.]|nr:cytochrome c biogenesis protein CcdA [Clostridium sp.]